MVAGSRPALRRVVFLPGGVTPVRLSYAPTLAELEGEVDPVLKELAVYESETPPADYSLRLEVEALRKTVDSLGLTQFHLVGFSGGGAVALAFGAAYPERLLSLALFEPANVPGRWDDTEQAFWAEFSTALRDLPPDEMLREFTRRQVRQGAELPPTPEPPPPWMAARPAGLNALMQAFLVDDTDRDRLRQLRAPVYLAYGLLTADFMVRRVQILAALLPDLWIEAYPGIHHFTPPQRSQPKHYAAALRSLWTRAEGPPGGTSGHGDQTYAA